MMFIVLPIPFWPLFKLHEKNIISMHYVSEEGNTLLKWAVCDVEGLCRERLFLIEQIRYTKILAAQVMPNKDAIVFLLLFPEYPPKGNIFIFFSCCYGNIQFDIHQR